MAKSTDKFYNMQVNIIQNGRIYAEQVAIQNVWKKEDNVFFDIYFHRLKKSFVFDAVFIHDILDISRDKSYTDINKFVDDFYALANELNEKDKCHLPKKEKGILSPLKTDITLLKFMAEISSDKSDIKTKIICDYIEQNLEAGKNMSRSYLLSHISLISCEIEDFYNALKCIKAKTPQQAIRLLKEIIKICLSDGNLHYTERMYLADIIQTLRINGLKLPDNLI